MMSIKRKLKKILAVLFIVTLLSNYISILSEVGNVVWASSLELTPEFTSDVFSDENENDISNMTDIEVKDSAIPNQESTVEKEDEEFPEESNESNEENSGEEIQTDSEETSEKANSGENLTQEEIEKLNSMSVSSELEINNFIKFDNSNGKGILAEVTIDLNIDAKELDIDSMQAEFEVPNISGILPYTYEIEDLNDKINVIKDGNNIICDINSVEDSAYKIKLICVYSEDAFSGTEIKITGNVRIEVEGYEALGNFEAVKEVTENTNIFATYGITSDTPSKYKGYLYANTVLENKKEFSYTTTDVVETKEADFVDEIIVENNIDKVVTNEREIDLVNLITYKSTSVSVEEFNSALGEDGYIEIYNQLGEKLGELNKDSEIKNNRYTFYYNIDIDKTVFKIKNIKNDKTINIKNEKVIKGSDTFSRDYVKSFKSIKSGTASKVAKIINENEIVIQQIYSENSINLEETESKMTLEMSTNDFITTEENEVTFTATLKTNEERYELFSNPTLSIELPSAVENAEIKSVNLMYKNGLSLENWQVVKNEQGLNVIQVSLTGTQNEYEPGTLIEGTTVLITAKLNLDRITANGKSAVKFRYTNDIATNISYQLEGKDSTDIEVNYVSRSGILKETKLENYNSENDVLVSYEDEAIIGTINANDSAKTAKVSTIIMNNYNEEINNVEIIGKIPFVGNSKDNVDLNTTFDTTITGPISLNGLVGKVYYSYDENPDKDIGNWSEIVEDFSKVKSFKVELDNNSMKIGEKIELSYNLNIPENVGYNASAYNLFTTYYDFNNQKIEDSSILGLVSEVKAINLEDCQVVEKTPELSIGTQVTRAGVALTETDEVNEGQILRYNVVLTNNSSNPITNINLKGVAENSNSYYCYKYTDFDIMLKEDVLIAEWKEDITGEHIYETKTIESLAPGETITFTYEAKVKHLDEISNPEVYGKVLISADGIEEKEYQTIKNKIRNAEIELIETIAGPETIEDDDMNLYTTNLYNFITITKNISDKDLENVKVNVMIPSMLELSQLEMGLYNESVDFSEQNVVNGKMVTFTIPKLSKGESKELIVSAKIASLDYTIDKTILSVTSNATIDGQLYLSNDYIRNVAQSEAFFNITYASTPENGSVVKDGDNIKYSITIQNLGVVDGIVDFTDFLDTGYKVNSAIITYPDGTKKEMEISEYNYIIEIYTLKPNEKLIIDIDGVVDASDFNTSQTKIESKLEIYPKDNLSEFENIVFYIDPSQVVAMPDDGVSDDETDDIENKDNEDNNQVDNTYNNEVLDENTNTIEPPEEIEDEPSDEVEPSKEIKNEQSDVKEEENSQLNSEENSNNSVNTSNNQTQDNKENNTAEETTNGEQTVNNISENITAEVINTTNVDAVKYSISGKAWLDSNKNGIYDEEELLESVKVMLLKSDNSDSSVIKDSNILKTVSTDEKGEYAFTGLDNGKYVVIFDYDNNLYEVSSYQVNGVSSTKTSDVIGKQLKLNSNEKVYAVSDIVEISESNINNVNIGLKESSDFDMEITTLIKKVVIENEKGIQTEEFTADDRIAKIEIPSKYLNSSKVTVEYVVKVTNKGKVSGYINQIADYIPEGMEFDNESSTNWKLGEDGVLYSSSLNKVLIAAGETKEINLIMTKSMNENNTGVYKNTAKIIDLTNDLQLSDSNSDNNSSEVELLISVKTGVVYYILVIVIILAIAFIGMLLVSKFIKDDKNKINLINKIIIIVSLIIIVALCFIIKVYARETYKSILTASCSSYLTNRYSLGTETYYADLTANSMYGDTRVQCVEGNITTPSGGANGYSRIVSDAKIIGKDYETIYLNSSSSTKTDEGNTLMAAKLAYISYQLEQSHSSYEGTMAYLLRSDGRSAVQDVLNISSTSMTIKNGTEFTTLLSNASKYANNLSSGGTTVSKSNNVSKLEYNSTYDGFGAITATFPNTAKLYIALDGKTYKEYTGKVKTANGDKNVSECSGKSFYIPFSAVSSASDLSKVAVKVEATSDVIQARILSCFLSASSWSGGQNQVVMRGTYESKPTKADYTLDAIADVEVSKTVYQKADAEGKNAASISEGAYVDRGDYVYYKITIKNNGAMATSVDLTDTYNANQYTLVNDGGLTKNSEGNLTKTNISIPKKDKKEYTVTLKVKDNVSANTNTELINTAKISNFKINNKSIVNKQGNKVEDSSYVKCKQYSISVEKTVDSITSIEGAAKSTETTVEVGDKIKYKIVVKNNGGTKSSTYGSITYKLSEDVPEGFEVVTSTNWTLENGKYVYSEKLSSGGTKTLYITMKVTKSLIDIKAVDKTNTVTITSTKNRNEVNLTNYLVNSNLSATATVKILGYKISVEKTVESITNAAGVEQSSKSIAEVGDTIKYKIVVKNHDGKESKLFGAIKYELSEDVPEGFEVKTHTNWTEKSGRWIASGTVASGETDTFYISMKVKDSLLDTKAVNKINTVTITSTKNKNNIELIDNLSNSTLSATATVKILGYKMSISKTVTSINNGEVTDLTKCELGDKITYTIKVKNTGSKATSFGNISNIVLEDTFKTNELKFISSNGTGWKKNSNTKYTYEGSLAPGETATLELNLEVILESKQKVNIENIATITNAKNRNNISLTHIIPISSTATLEYQTYDMGIWKYITRYNNSAITGRENKTNDEKYNSPVEVEKYDNVIYTIKVQNTGTTVLNNVKFVDTLETGLTYNSTVLKKKYNALGKEDLSKSQIKENVNGNTITYTYPDELKAGEYIVIQIKCNISMSNMYLLNLKNEVNITNIYNRNDIDLIHKDLINYTNKDNIDYVRLKNLTLSGQVWLDENRNGLMDNTEKKLSGIKVILHDDTNKKVAETVTDANGKYVFAETNGTGNGSNKKMVEGGNNSGRIIKATNRNDTTGNYDATSQYINYYVEFYYNGVRYEDTVYSGRNNLNATDNSITNNYKIDSNASECNDIREELNKNFETIEYNKAIKGIEDTGSNTKTISYEKKDHESLLELTSGTSISAYSFIKTSNSNYGKGLTNGSNIDMLFFSQSGETEYLKYINLGLMTRDIDLSIKQDVEALENTINGSQMTYKFAQSSVNNSPYGGEYVTGGTSNPINYVFNYYASDYHYNHTQYSNAEVISYKTNTELNTEITYKMTITNNNVNDPGNVKAIVREVVNYYSSDFVQYNPASNTKTIKIMNDQGYLENATINNVEAWYKTKTGATGTVTLSNTPRYPEHAKVNLNGKYNKIYLTGFDNVKLAQGESFDIFIKFVVNTKNSSTELKLGDKNNIVEINAYSTYYESNKPAGYVDKNSNPGNLGIQTSSSSKNGIDNANIDRYSDYENDTYKTGIKLTTSGDKENPPEDPPGTPPGPPEGKLERVLKGTVWDDARSEAIWDKSQASKIEDAKDLQYVGNGLMNIGGSSPDKRFRQEVKGIVYEPASNQKKIGKTLVHDESQDRYAEGISANLVEIIKIPDGNGGTKIYEESGNNIATWSDAVVSSRSNADGSYKLESFIPGNYVIRFIYGEDKADVSYNGQEYKSTAFNTATDYGKTIDELASGNTKQDADNVLSTLEKSGKNDARDDEIRRLEVIAYSELVTNYKTEEAQAITDYTTDFMKNTNMNAETVTFPVRTEKVTYNVTELSFNQMNNKVFKIENIDFGLEYRPEVSVTIQEFLSEIKLTTSDGNTLVDINFDNTYEEGTERIIGTTPNMKDSIGLENLQYLPSQEDVKGLAYLNVDVDLLQGCTVDITYVFSVNNESENDRITQTLYDLKYKQDASEALQRIGAAVGADGTYNTYFDDDYTAAGTARNELYASFYNGKAYRNRVKTAYTGNNGYYGKYLGNTYYTGAISNDKLAEVKIDKILDYVDNDMTMQTDKNSQENRFWTTTTDEELLSTSKPELRLITSKLFKEINTEGLNNGIIQSVKINKLVDAKGISFDSDSKHNLAITVDDKVSENDQTNMNKALSRFLTTYQSDINNSFGSIYIVTSKVISSESDTEDMTYDNSAEIIQYTSSTGRVSGLSATVGNLNMQKDRDLSITPSGKPNYKEEDEATTERVTLTPPTGLEKARYYVSVAKDKLISTIIGTAIAVVMIVLKKSLKHVSFKKFYK